MSRGGSKKGNDRDRFSLSSLSYAVQKDLTEDRLLPKFYLELVFTTNAPGKILAFLRVLIQRKADVVGVLQASREREPEVSMKVEISFLHYAIPCIVSDLCFKHMSLTMWSSVNPLANRRDFS
jgi:hypothetical protein